MKYGNFRHYNSGEEGALYSQVIFYNYPGWRPSWPNDRRWVIYRIKLEDAQPGQLIMAWGDAEVTSERDTNTEFVSVLKLSDSVNGQGYLDKEISEVNGANIDLDMHHYKVSQNGSIVIPDDQSIDYDNLHVLWKWGAGDGPLPPPYLWVGAGEHSWNDYGRLMVNQHDPVI